MVAVAELAHGREERPPDVLAESLASCARRQVATRGAADVLRPAHREGHGAHGRVDNPGAARGRRRELCCGEVTAEAVLAAPACCLWRRGADDVRRAAVGQAADGGKGEALPDLVRPGRLPRWRQGHHEVLRGRHQVAILREPLQPRDELAAEVDAETLAGLKREGPPQRPPALEPSLVLQHLSDAAEAWVGHEREAWHAQRPRGE
mmetsp:Transcript_66136/g.204921  ORF Transcript_66136/g.204921 Transcript_66136/m.204921 type:complete len:206 (-) Transcript_66136:555-1172(-)